MSSKYNPKNYNNHIGPFKTPSIGKDPYGVPLRHINAMLYYSVSSLPKADKSYYKKMAIVSENGTDAIYICLKQGNSYSWLDVMSAIESSESEDLTEIREVIIKLQDEINNIDAVTHPELNDTVTQINNSISTVDNKVDVNTNEITNINNVLINKLEESDISDLRELVNSIAILLESEDVLGSEADTDLITRKELENLFMIEVTYAELVELRSNSKLIPGMFYRITDYEFITDREDIQSAEHQFDIIVQALTINKLSEEAKAAIHRGDDYFGKVLYWEPNEVIYNFEVTGEPEDALTRYLISVDGFPYGYGGTEDNPTAWWQEEREFADFREWEYKNKPGTEQIVPVLWDECSDGILYNDCYYYWGDKVVDGHTYNMWAKYIWLYDWDSDEYPMDEDGRIFSGTIVLTDPIVQQVQVGPIITWVYDLYINSNGVSFSYPGNIIPDDDLLSTHNWSGKSTDTITRIDYAIAPEDYLYSTDEDDIYLNYAGERVPVFYKSDPDSDYPESNDSLSWHPDTYYYNGQFEFDGETYDIWAKFGDGSQNAGGSGSYGFQYMFAITQPVVDVDTLTFIDNIELEDYTGLFLENASPLNKWELRYSLDNDIDKFDWACSRGKGVIYYMKDEYNNEASYDFKNVMFARYYADSVQYTIYNSTVRVNGLVGNYIAPDCWAASYDMDDYIYRYTFMGKYDEDGSLTGFCNNNKIEPYSNGGKLYLNNITIRDAHDNEFKHNCYNIFVKGYCHNNTITNSHCIYVSEFWDNKIESECYQIIAESLYKCIFEGNNNIIIVNGNMATSTLHEFAERIGTIQYSQHNEFGYGSGNILLNNATYNTIGNRCRNIQMSSETTFNTLGDDCQNITFGYDNHYNKIGNSCTYLTLGNHSTNNIFMGNNNSIHYGSSEFLQNCTFDVGASSINIVSSYMQYCSFGKGVYNIEIGTNETTSSSSPLKFIRVYDGVGAGHGGIPINIRLPLNPNGNGYNTEKIVKRADNGNWDEYIIGI